MLRNFLATLIVAATALGQPSAALGVEAGASCGGIAGTSCNDELWCDPEPNECGAAHVAGACVEVPTVCTRIFKPVCGCDGKTYGNDCERRAAKVAKKSDGECKTKSE